MLKLRKIVLASANAGKIREIADLFSDLDIEIIPQGSLGIESAEETGATFVENALLKARHAAEASGLPAVADDSGISVDALGGMPGVHSARYAGLDASDEANLDLLLDEMSEVSEDDRGGGFHCAAVMYFPGDAKASIVAEGIWRGRILRQRIGDGGFGYDPIFYDEDTGKTGAQMSRDEKNAVSHRGKAFAELKRKIRERFRSD